MILVNDAIKRTKAYVAFQVRVSPELKEKLARHASKVGTSQQAVVNAALTKYLRKDIDGQKK